MSFFHTGKLLKEVNNTVITLVQKGKCPDIVTHFSPTTNRETTSLKPSYRSFATLTQLPMANNLAILNFK